MTASPSRRIALAAVSAGLASAALAGAAQAQPYGRPGPMDRPSVELSGGGVPDLLPELRETRRGRAFVLDGFDLDRNGRISRREADAANRAFLRDGPGDGRDDRRGDGRRGPPPPPPPEVREVQPLPGRGASWDREGMRAYRFREGRYGATFDLSDVLFRTGSAELLPQAQDKLRPLAGYLRANRGQRVRLDGHTDSVGSDAANLQLSQARVRAVEAALVDMGADPDRIRLEGHGEAEPRASNATAEGRQQNRRVEIALEGRRASEFR